MVHRKRQALASLPLPSSRSTFAFVFLCLRFAALWPSPTCNHSEQTHPLVHTNCQRFTRRAEAVCIDEQLRRRSSCCWEWSRPEQSVIILHFAFLGVGSKRGPLEQWWWLGSIFSLTWPHSYRDSCPSSSSRHAVSGIEESSQPVRDVSALCLVSRSVPAPLNLFSGLLWNTEVREATLALRNQNRGAEVRQWVDVEL